MTARSFILIALRSLATFTQVILCTSSLVHAQSIAFPTKAVRIVVTYPPGGTVDLLARAIGQKLTEGWGQSVIVENRVGASGIIGTEYVAKSAADGYTLLICAMTHATTVAIYSKLPYDPLADFTPLSLVASSPMVLIVNRSLPVASVGDLIRLAKRNPNQLNYGSGGNGTSQHMATELLRSMTGIAINHVPYKGNAPATVDLIAGEIQFMIDQLAAAFPHIKSQKVKALAVTGATRAAVLPEVRTMTESGVRGYEMIIWFGALGPARIPDNLTMALSDHIARTLKAADVAQRLSSQGLDLLGTKPREFDSFLRKEIDKWKRVVRESEIRLE